MAAHYQHTRADARRSLARSDDVLINAELDFYIDRMPTRITAAFFDLTPEEGHRLDELLANFILVIKKERKNV